MICLAERFPAPQLYPTLIADCTSRVQSDAFYRGWVFDEDKFVQRVLARGIRVVYIK